MRVVVAFGPRLRQLHAEEILDAGNGRSAGGQSLPRCSRVRDPSSSNPRPRFAGHSDCMTSTVTVLVATVLDLN